LKDHSGQFATLEDKRLDPIIDFLERRHIPLIGHVGEPKNCWLPFSAMNVRSDREYYEQHPEYHMYQHPEYPSYEQLLAARDRTLLNHPDLTFVGAHLASLESDVDQLAGFLDRFPHAAVDVAARIPHLQVQTRADRAKVQRFFIAYQDRIMYGTDQAVGPKRDPKAVRARAHDIWTRDWRFLTTDDTMTSPAVDGAFRGVKLPRTVIDKIYLTNSERWITRRRES